MSGHGARAATSGYAATLAQIAYTVTLQLPAKADVSCASAVQPPRSPAGELRVIASEFDVVFTAAPPPSTFLPLGQETLWLLTVFEFVDESAVTSCSPLTPTGPAGPAGPWGPTAPIELGSFPFASSGSSMFGVGVREAWMPFTAPALSAVFALPALFATPARSALVA